MSEKIEIRIPASVINARGWDHPSQLDFDDSDSNKRIEWRTAITLGEYVKRGRGHQLVIKVSAEAARDLAEDLKDWGVVFSGSSVDVEVRRDGRAALYAARQIHRQIAQALGEEEV